MSDEDNVRRPEDDPFMPEPYRYIFQLIKQQAERSAAFEAETRRNFDTVAGHLATLAVGLDTLREQVGRVAAKVDRTADGMSALRGIAEIQSAEIKDLADSVKVVDERTRRTDERLDALINTVERIISDRQNGKGGE